MGRPIKKKFFANLNAPYQDHATGGPTGEGGESVVSVTINTVGSYTAALPTVTFGDPDLFSGVVAEGIVHGNALSAATTSNGTGYNFGDTLTVVGGTRTSAATFTVAETVVVAAVKSNGGSGYNDGDVLTFSTGFSPSLTLRVNRPGGGTGTPDDFTIVQAGRRTSANPTNPVAYDSRTGTGNGCTVTLTFGVYSFSSVVVQGDYTVIPASPVSFTGGGTGAAATVPFGVSGVVITNVGSNYISAADADAVFSSGAAAGTAVLGNVRDNGLAAYAYIIDGTEGVLVDIMKQESSRRYLVKDDDGVQGQCRLVATDASYLDPGQMCLIATDTQGCTYFVTKLTARRAYLTQRTSAGTGYQFADGTSAGWNISGAVTGRVSLASV
jgi:voltage-gated potassium channel Kch